MGSGPGYHVLEAVAGVHLAPAVGEGPDAVGVAPAHQPVPSHLLRVRVRVRLRARARVRVTVRVRVSLTLTRARTLTLSR